MLLLRQHHCFSFDVRDFVLGALEAQARAPTSTLWILDLNYLYPPFAHGRCLKWQCHSLEEHCRCQYHNTTLSVNPITQHLIPTGENSTCCVYSCRPRRRSVQSHVLSPWYPSNTEHTFVGDVSIICTRRKTLWSSHFIFDLFTSLNQHKEQSPDDKFHRWRSIFLGMVCSCPSWIDMQVDMCTVLQYPWLWSIPWFWSCRQFVNHATHGRTPTKCPEMRLSVISELTYNRNSSSRPSRSRCLKCF